MSGLAFNNINFKDPKLYKGPVYAERKAIFEESDPNYNNLLIACPFDGTYLDYSKYSLTPTISGTQFVSPQVSSNSKIGPKIANKCLWLDAVSDRLTYTLPEPLGLSPFTIELFFKPNAQNSYSDARLLQIGANGAPGMIILFRNGVLVPIALRVQRYSGGYGNLVINSTVTIPEYTWSHVALTRDLNGLFYLYINGIKINGVAGVESYNLDETVLYIGADSGLASLMHCWILDLRIYKGIVKYRNNFNVDWKRLKMVSK